MQQNATIGNLCLSIPRFPGLRYAPALRACLRHPFQSGVGSFFFLQSTNLDAEHRGIEPSAQINTYAQNDHWHNSSEKVQNPQKSNSLHFYN